MSFPAPYDRFRGEVLPEWIDYNNHMNLAYYTVLFDRSTDLLFDELGLGLDYRRDRQLGTFVAETHNLYERELLVGAGVRVATQILGADDKRLHLGHEMFALDGGPPLRDAGADVPACRPGGAAGMPVSRRHARPGLGRGGGAAGLPAPDGPAAASRCPDAERTITNGVVRNTIG